MSNRARLRICIISYGSISTSEGGLYTNPAITAVLNHLATQHDVRYVAVGADKKASTYDSGRPIYSVRISEAVNAVPLQSRDGLGKLAVVSRIAGNSATIARAVWHTDFALIYLPSYTNLIACLLSILFRRKFALYVGSHWQTLYRAYQGGSASSLILEKIYGLVIDHIYDRAGFTLVTGNRIYKEISRAGRHVFQAVPSVSFRAYDDTGEKKATFSEDGPINLLFVGPVNSIKGVVYLVRALKILKERELEVHLHIIGALHRSYKEELNREIERGRLSDLITFYGYIAKKTLLAEVYAKADIFVLPSVVEGFPRVIYEAMMSKLPVISSDLPSIRGNIDDPDCVYFVPPKDPEAIANAVQELGCNGDLRRKMVQTGLEFVRTKVPKREHYEQVADLISRYG